MPGIRSTKRGSAPLLAGYGIPVLTQAVWTSKKEPEPSNNEEAWKILKSRLEKSPQTKNVSVEDTVAVQLIAAVGRFPSRQATYLVIWGVVLVVILPIAFAAFGGNGAAKRASAAPSRAAGGSASGAPVRQAAAKTAASTPLNAKQQLGAAVAPVERKDQALEVLETLGSDDLYSAEELATGRFLEEIVEKIPFVRGMDLETISVIARGPGWARLEARYRPSKPWFEKQEEEQVLVLDLVEEEARWKLEDVRVTPRSNP